MPAYKYKTKSGQTKWMAKFYYEDAKTNKRKQKKKEGFELKREAEEFERDFLTNNEKSNINQNLSLPFYEFARLYLDSKKKSVSITTYMNYKYIFDTYIFSSFKKPINELKTAELQNWTDSLISTYDIGKVRAKNIYTQMRAVFNYAERIYGLNPNPVRALTAPKAREPHKEMEFWTLDEFKQVISVVEDLKYKSMLTVLFYTGIRKGELFGLTWNDLDGDLLSINKQLQRINGKSYITPTKTSSSIRKILLPKQVTEILTEWKQYSYGEQIFEWEKNNLEKEIISACQKTGVKRIRVHDLRHSHASYLISKGANIELISKRLGHAKTSMTMDTYGHLYPTDEHKIIDIIESE